MKNRQKFKKYIYLLIIKTSSNLRKAFNMISWSVRFVRRDIKELNEKKIVLRVDLFIFEILWIRAAFTFCLTLLLFTGEEINSDNRITYVYTLRAKKNLRTFVWLMPPILFIYFIWSAVLKCQSILNVNKWLAVSEQ